MKKKILLILALGLIISSTAAFGSITAFAKTPEPTVAPGDKIAVILNAGFHCGAGGGNGRVWIKAYDDKYEAAKAAKEKGVREDLINIDETTWQLADIMSYECPVCGSTFWASYSNKSGIPDGKNMQFTHFTPDDGEGEFFGGGHDCEIALTYWFQKALNYCVTNPEALWTAGSWANMQTAIGNAEVFLYRFHNPDVCVCDINNMDGGTYEEMIALMNAIQDMFADGAMDYRFDIESPNYIALSALTAEFDNWVKIVGGYAEQALVGSGEWKALEQAIIDGFELLDEFDAAFALSFDNQSHNFWNPLFADAVGAILTSFRSLPM